MGRLARNVVFRVDEGGGSLLNYSGGRIRNEQPNGLGSQSG